MKKVLTILSIIIMGVVIVGCGKTTTKPDSTITQPGITTTTTKENVNIKIIAPNGAPAISQSSIQKNKPSLGENVNYDITIVAGKDPLVSAFTNKDYDIVFAPLDLGAQLYTKGVLDYKLTATITFGNVYLATQTTEEFTLDSLSGKKVTLFGQNSSPDLVTRHVLEDVENVTYEYLNATTDTQSLLISNPTEIALVAEPQLTALTKKVQNIKVIDIQELYAAKMGVDYYPQASVFVKNDLINNHKDIVDKYLEELAKSALKANTSLEEVADTCVELNYPFAKPVLLDSIPRSNIGFAILDGNDKNLKTYFEFILEKNSKLLNGKLPDEGFYYKK